jgi:hypothetical protein
MKTVCFCDNDIKKFDTLNKNWPRVPIISDIRYLTLEMLYALNIPKIDVICAGFPCQDISMAGKGDGINGEKSGIWNECLRVIQEVCPKYVILENSEQLRTRGLEQVLEDLASIGFNADWMPISGSSVGAPHQRDRMWIIAYRFWEPVVFGGDCFMEGEGSESICSHCREDYAECVCLGPDSCEEFGYKLVIEEWGPVAYPNAIRWPEQRRPVPILKESIALECFDWFEHEPAIPRVDDGATNRPHRVAALGDSLVTWIPYLIGKVVIEFDESEGRE